MRKWILVALAAVAMPVLVSDCGDDDDAGSSATTQSAIPTCGVGDLAGDVISDFKVDVVSKTQAKATFVLSRDAEVGVVVRRREQALRFVGRVPFGPQRSVVVNEKTFDLVGEDGAALSAGDYQFTLRAFEAGKLNVGDPIDTKSHCVRID